MNVYVVLSIISALFTSVTSSIIFKNFNIKYWIVLFLCMCGIELFFSIDNNLYFLIAEVIIIIYGIICTQELERTLLYTSVYNLTSSIASFSIPDEIYNNLYMSLIIEFIACITIVSIFNLIFHRLKPLHQKILTLWVIAMW